jgi:CHAT domain-containing protein
VEKRRSVRRELFARLPELPVWRGLGPAATSKEAAGVLRTEGDILAEFVIDDDDLLIVLLTRGAEGSECRTYVTPIGRQVLAARIAHAVEPAVLRDADQWRTASAELVKAIPPAAWTALAAAPHIVLVPDDVLWRVPFEALPVDAGFLADRTTVTYAGSATSLVSVPTVAPPLERTRAVIVGSPELPPSARDRLNVTSPGWTLPDTDAASAEARTIAGLFEESAVTQLAGASATEAALRGQGAGASLIHAAAPFRMNGASPLFSPLLLTADPAAASLPADNDGVLELREVMNLELRARVVVFSDGGTASLRGAAPAAEFVRWAWRAAGVPAVVLSRWRTEPAESMRLLKELYVRLKDGSTPEIALEGARAAVRAAADTRAPYFWAGWMAVGQ